MEVLRRLAAGALAAGLCASVPAARGDRGVTTQAAGLQAPAPRPEFAAWLAELRAEALARGFDPALVDRAFGDIALLPAVVERDRGQVERILSLDRYLARRVTPRAVRTGRQMAAQHAALLRRVEREHGVPPHVVVAVWGLESNFGRFIGTRPTLTALATLAYDDRRPAFFRSQFFDALAILQRGDIELERLIGSWAGALGQPQFMPSSYLKYAVDFDGDGRRDIWASHADIFGSIGNYLAVHGWQAGTRWGREVRAGRAVLARVDEAVARRAGGGCSAERELTEARPLERWHELGVRLAGGGPLPRADLDASLARVGGRTFLVYRNYEALLAYNCSHLYALSVAQLADRIAAP